MRQVEDVQIGLVILVVRYQLRRRRERDEQSIGADAGRCRIHEACCWLVLRHGRNDAAAILPDLARDQLARVHRALRLVCRAGRVGCRHANAARAGAIDLFYDVLELVRNELDGVCRHMDDDARQRRRSALAREFCPRADRTAGAGHIGENLDGELAFFAQALALLAKGFRFAPHLFDECREGPALQIGWRAGRVGRLFTGSYASVC